MTATCTTCAHRINPETQVCDEAWQHTPCTLGGCVPAAESAPEPEVPPMDADQAREAVLTIPGRDGWWHVDGGETYVELVNELMQRGFSPYDAVGLLESAYAAAAEEFGQ